MLLAMIIQGLNGMKWNCSVALESFEGVRAEGALHGFVGQTVLMLMHLVTAAHENR